MFLVAVVKIFLLCLELHISNSKNRKTITSKKSFMRVFFIIFLYSRSQASAVKSAERRVVKYENRCESWRISFGLSELYVDGVVFHLSEHI